MRPNQHFITLTMTSDKIIPCAEPSDAAAVVREHIDKIDPNTTWGNLINKHKLMMGVIFARGVNDEFGLNDTLPWRSREDLAFFSKVTAGSTVIMGRKTYDSLPVSSKPLSGRRNIVVTSKPDQLYNGKFYSVNGLQAALDLARNFKRMTWVIGGRSLIEEALQVCKVAVTSSVQYAGPADVRAPVLPQHFEAVSLMRYEKIIQPGVIHVLWDNPWMKL